MKRTRSLLSVMFLLSILTVLTLFYSPRTYAALGASSTSDVLSSVLSGGSAADVDQISLSGGKEKNSYILSPALNVLSAKHGMAKWTLIGNDIYFCEDDFCRALNLAEIPYITVTKLPEKEFGTLVLGSTPVSEGQTLSASNLALMKYVPADDTTSASSSSFEFTCGENVYTTVCTLYIIEKNNFAPTVSSKSAASLTCGTFQGITAHGSIGAYDPEGDALTFEIVEYPKNGYLKLSDPSNGNCGYTYTPKDNYSGKDSFKYVAIDKYGNYAPSATVNITVNKRKTNIVFSDLDNSKYQSHAVSVTEAGIMSGTQIGNGYYFYPEQSVSRIEFLVMAMNAAGITEVANVKNTGFYDDADIPSAMKGYAAVAYRLGYLHGTVENGELCFKPHEAITRAEAAYIFCNILDLEYADNTVTVFADSVPSWAETAIYTMNYYGILRDDNGKISSYAKLCRGDAAQMLDAVIRMKG